MRKLKLENIIDIYNLLPEEIDNAIKKLSTALNIIKQRLRQECNVIKLLYFYLDIKY
mgnify:CR=1 FL=1